MMPQMTILGLFEAPVFSNPTFFLAVTIVFGGLIGVLSRSLVIAVYSAFFIFMHVTIETNIAIFETTLYVILAIAMVIMGLRIWAYGMGGRNSPT